MAVVIPDASVPLVDAKTGLITKDWYPHIRFLIDQANQAQSDISDQAGDLASRPTLDTNIWTQQQGFTRVNLTDAANISWDVQTQQTAAVTLTASVGHPRIYSRHLSG